MGRLFPRLLILGKPFIYMHLAIASPPSVSGTKAALNKGVLDLRYYWPCWNEQCVAQEWRVPSLGRAAKIATPPAPDPSFCQGYRHIWSRICGPDQDSEYQRHGGLPGKPTTPQGRSSNLAYDPCPPSAFVRFYPSQYAPHSGSCAAPTKLRKHPFRGC